MIISKLLRCMRYSCTRPKRVINSPPTPPRLLSAHAGKAFHLHSAGQVGSDTAALAWPQQETDCNHRHTYHSCSGAIQHHRTISHTTICAKATGASACVMDVQASCHPLCLCLVQLSRVKLQEDNRISLDVTEQMKPGRRQNLLGLCGARLSSHDWIEWMNWLSDATSLLMSEQSSKVINS